MVIVSETIPRIDVFKSDNGSYKNKNKTRSTHIGRIKKLCNLMVVWTIIMIIIIIIQ